MAPASYGAVKPWICIRVKTARAFTSELLGDEALSKSVIPRDFGISQEMRAWAELKASQVDIDKEHEAFCDYWAGHGTKMADWVATWRTWMRRAPQMKGAMRRPDDAEITRLMSVYTAKGFRRAFQHETSTLYTSAFRDWQDRDLPQRDLSNILNIARAKRV